MEGFLVIGGVLVLVIGLYILTYYLNSKTEVPEGIEPASCSTCNSASCTLRVEDGPIDLEKCETEKLK